MLILILLRAPIELTYNWGKSDYQIGTGFGHIAINVADVSQAVEVAKQLGVEVIQYSLH
jgi:lactoylglutathione lyase